MTGEAGRDALAVAEQILLSIANHAWDPASQPAAGPAAVPYPRIVPVPERKAG